MYICVLDDPAKITLFLLKETEIHKLNSQKEHFTILAGTMTGKPLNKLPLFRENGTTEERRPTRIYVDKLSNIQ